MDQAFIDQVLKIESFFMELQGAVNEDVDNNLHFNIISYDEEDNCSFHSSIISIPSSTPQHFITLFNSIHIAIKSLLTDNPGDFYIKCMKILNLIQILLNDTESSLEIALTEVAERSDLKVLNNEGLYKITIDLMSFNHENTNMNIYYMDATIEKFLFSQKMPSTKKMEVEQFETIKNEDDSNLSEVIAYIHNLRAFLGCLVCQTFYLSRYIREKCTDAIITNNKELYLGQIQKMNRDISLGKLISCPNINFLIKSLQDLNISSIDTNNLLKSDNEIFNWIHFMSNIQPELDKLKSNEQIDSEFDKFCLLVVYSYDNFPNSQLDDRILKLCDDCMDLIKSETEFTKKISEWPLFNFMRIFQMTYPIHLLLYGEIQKRVVVLIKDKTKIINSFTKIREYKTNSQNRNVKDSEIRYIVNIISSDIVKLKNLTKFILHTNWLENNIQSTTGLYNDFQDKIAGLSKLRQEIQNKL